MELSSDGANTGLCWEARQVPGDQRREVGRGSRGGVCPAWTVRASFRRQGHWNKSKLTNQNGDDKCFPEEQMFPRGKEHVFRSPEASGHRAGSRAAWGQMRLGWNPRLVSGRQGGGVVSRRYGPLASRPYGRWVLLQAPARTGSKLSVLQTELPLVGQWQPTAETRGKGKVLPHWNHLCSQTHL